MKNRVVKQRLFQILMAVLFSNITMANTAKGQKNLDIKITVSIVNLNLERALFKLENETKIKFSYDSKLTKLNQKINIESNNQTLSTILNEILNPLNISYSEINNQIILQEKGITHVDNSNSLVSIIIKGKVTDKNGLPIPGVSVLEKGTNNGVQTDFDGIFSINVTNKKAILIVTYLGYESKEIPLNGESSITVILNEESKALKEVVVIGYGAQQKTKITGAIGQISLGEIKDFPVSNFDQALVGKLAGVQVLQTSGQPGKELTIKVRGTGTLTAGNNPLYVIDGIPIETAGQATEIVNFDDIESIQVLKDAAAASIYGSRGSNGVVLVNTKKGKQGKMNIDFNTFTGFQQLSKKIDMMDAYQYAQLSRDGHNAAYLQEIPTASLDDPNSIRSVGYYKVPEELFPYLNGVQGLTNTDWQDAIYRSAQIQKYNLSFRGGSENINYFISASHSNQDGIIINSDYQKTGLKATIGIKSKKFKIGLNLVPSFTRENRVNSDDAWSSNGIVQSALAYSPTWPIYNPDGSFNYQGNGYWRKPIDYQHNEIINPVALAVLTKNEVIHNNMIGDLFFEYEIIENLKLKSSYAINYNNYQNEYYVPAELETRGVNNFGILSNPTAKQTSTNLYNWTIENTINYKKSFENHNFDLLGGITAQKSTGKLNRITSSVTSDTPVTNASQVINAHQIATADIETNEWSLYSLLARAQYDYEAKYLVSASIRADASSRFGADNKWGYFPSVSAGWRISQEAFLKNNEWLNELKLRISYGLTGNFDIGNYEQISAISADTYVTGDPGQIQTGLRPTQIPNPDLSWETTEMTNVGVDLEFFNRQLGFIFEYYNANTKDLLLDVPVPEITGFTTSLQNIGKVNNKGIEATMKLSPDLGQFKWTANMNVSVNRNKVISLGSTNADIIQEDAGGTFWLTRVGEPIGSYYLLIQDGIFSTKAELDQYPHFDNTQVGDFRFVDVDGDGTLDVNKDRAIVGNYAPDFTYGISNDFNYEGFDLSVSFTGSYGGEILNLSRRYLASGEGNFNNTTELLNRWYSEEYPGDGNTNRANRKATGNNARGSTFFLEDGSYLRLQNVSFGFSLPHSVLEKLKISKIRVYITGNNLYTWTKYTGYNPEVNLRENNQLTPGVDYGVYPLATTYSLGVNMSF